MTRAVVDSIPLAAARPAPSVLAAGLAAARRARGISFVVLPAPVVAAPWLVAAAPAGALVAWSAGELALVGIGAARELRGTGETRWHELAAAARTIEVGAVVGGEVRPRFLGGAAFAPGAADRAPWSGFGDAWFVLPRWTYLRDGARAQLVLALDAEDAREAARWHGEHAALSRAIAGGFAPRAATLSEVVSIERGDTTGYRALVRGITDAIARGECAKVVAARAAEVALGSDARAADVLAALDERQPGTTRIAIRPPSGATLIAATPERLVGLAGRTAMCDALAGSHARGDGAAEALLASAKDRREHALVVDAIAAALRGLGGEVTLPAAPRVRELRDVVHLHTPITAELAERCHVLELAAALHPTPAVGGTPTAYATQWIAAHEATPRGWYAAPVGWFDLEGDGELAVAIRSGVLDGARAHLWAGAGIVAGSDPDRELAETDVKLRALLGAMGGIS